jgi:hypothetical protein
MAMVQRDLNAQSQAWWFYTTFKFK